MAQEVFGLALGPFAVMNIIGTATNLNAVRNLGALGPYYTPAKGLVTHGDQNTPWEIEAGPADLDDETRAVIADRLINSVLLPVCEELHEGTATLEAIDRGAERAFRFARTPGAMLRELGDDAVPRLRAFAESRGHPTTRL